MTPPASAMRAALCTLAGLLATGAANGASPPTALDILRESVSFRTLPGTGQVQTYAEYLRSVLLDAGFNADEVRVEPFGEGDRATATLTARYPGRDPRRKPILVIGHMDVVDARREDWKRDPFAAAVEDGYVFGRGVMDNKFDISMQVTALAKLRRSGWRPGRDIILALSGDEETLGASARHLASQFREAEFVLNGDAGGGRLAEDGSPIAYAVQGAEKTYVDMMLTVTDVGGHSARPSPNNAIHTLARALGRIEAFSFPARTNEITSAYFKAIAPTTPGPAGEAMRRLVANPTDGEAIAALSRFPEYAGQLRTTCVPTLLSAGHARNALPQRATANVNCWVLPGDGVARVHQQLVEVIADERVQVSYDAERVNEAPTSPLREDVMRAIRKVVHARHPGLTIVPSMSAGATDGAHYRAAGVPTYGVSSLFIRSSDDFAHGLDERVPLGAIDSAVEHWEGLLRELAR